MSLAPGRPRHLSRLFLRAVCVPLLLLLVLGLILVSQLSHLLALLDLVERTDAVIRQSHRVQLLLANREASLSGFLITGATEFLEPFTRGRDEVPRELRRLEALVPDNPPQGQRIVELRSLTAAWERYAEAAIQRRNGEGDVVEFVRSGSGRHLTDEMRRVLTTFRGVEAALRKQRTLAADAERRRSFGTFGLFSILLGVALALYTRREISSLSSAYNRMLDERERAAVALQESEHRFRRLAENAPDIIYRIALKPQLRFEFVSQVVTRTVGYTPEEHYADPDLIFRMIHPLDRQKLEALLSDSRENGPVSLRWVSRDGAVVWIDHHVTPVLDAEGRVEAIEGIARDVTPQRELQLELHRSQEFLTSVLDTVSECVVSCDRVGRITYANRAAKELYPEHGEAPPSDWLNHLHFFRPDGQTPLAPDERPLHRALLGEEVRNVEVVAELDGSAPRRFLASGRAMSDAEGRKTGAVIVLSDITDRVRAQQVLHETEAQLYQSQKMEAVGRLAGGIAHDFNNMLAAILGYSEILLWRQDLDPASRSQIEEISAAANRAATLTRQLLTFSRRQVVAAKQIDLNQTVNEVHGMLRRLIGEDIELITVPASQAALVMADPSQVEQVLINLVVNARDAMPEGGRLTVEIQNVDLDDAYASEHAEVTAGPYVMLAVSDTGHGMDRETQSHIFEPFYTTKSLGAGTGLGLATVYGIIKQSGGHVWVYSEPGRGSTFKIYLPRVSCAPQVKPTETPLALARGTETILLVEDEPFVRAVARQILEMSGYQVLEAGHGADALRVSAEFDGPIHLLLTDVVMPQMNGRELAQALAPLRPEVRVLFMSGYTDDAVVRHGVLSAEVSFVQKPFTAVNLARKVREVLDA
ncbi:MAG: CHASE3 domain-containing protein [Actinomycetota bacterium]